MTKTKDIRRLMLPQVLKAEAYAAVDPPAVLARRAGISEGEPSRAFTPRRTVVSRPAAR